MTGNNPFDTSRGHDSGWTASTAHVNRMDAGGLKEHSRHLPASPTVPNRQRVDHARIHCQLPNHLPTHHIMCTRQKRHMHTGHTKARALAAPCLLKLKPQFPAGASCWCPPGDSHGSTTHTHGCATHLLLAMPILLTGETSTAACNRVPKHVVWGQVARPATLNPSSSGRPGFQSRTQSKPLPVASGDRSISLK
jgi:hypothetical protein